MCQILIAALLQSMQNSTPAIFGSTVVYLHYAVFDFFLTRKEGGANLPESLRFVADHVCVRRLLQLYRNVSHGGRFHKLAIVVGELFEVPMQVWSLHFKAKTLPNGHILGAISLPTMNCIFTPVLLYANVEIKCPLLFDACLDARVTSCSI